MAETNEANFDGCFKEAVCIDAGRIYDSCCSRDCLEDLRCYFSTDTQKIIDQAISVHIKNAEVLKVYIDVEPVSFNRGYFSCDLTFFFLVEFDAFLSLHSAPKQIKGITAFNKRVILFGSEGNVKIFSNEVTVEEDTDKQLRMTNNMPRCVVQCVEPVALGSRLCEVKNQQDCCCIPTCVCNYLGGDLVTELPVGSPTVYATLGLFTVVQLIRNVQMLIPVYDFCIPDKECNAICDDRQPCDMFSKIKFPTNDFFPPSINSSDSENNCGCTN